MHIHFRSVHARRRERAAWQEVALAAGFLSGQHFLGANDLHYGYWRDGLEPGPRNLAPAQECYSEFLLEHIPKDAQRVLDVGCGAGSIASKLIDRGHEVDCVSPSSLLNAHARERLHERARMFECKYEDFQTADYYDAILFCESFQYVNMEEGLSRAFSQLKPGGSLIICDIFRLPTTEKCPIGGGHRLTQFQRTISQFAFHLVEEIDITERTAPTYTVIDDVFSGVLQPIWNEVDRALVKTHPVWSRCVNAIFAKRISIVKRKYFSHRQTAENFRKFKTYRLMRFEKD
jgi:cyclopropane fatty-acyl-phospholipid synthase-like methyltransferase